MSIFGRFRRESKHAQFEQVLMRLIAAQEGLPGDMVTPKSCMASPTVHAIVTAISRRLSVTPVHVYEKSMENGKEIKKKLPNHPVSTLLARPNEWQTRSDFWMDAASTWVRWGRFYAYKSQGGTGRIAALIPLNPGDVEPKLEDNRRFTYEVQEKTGKVPYSASKMFHARGAARNFIEGDSPIADIQTAVMMEILAERFGESFFRNGAIPMQIFRYMQGFRPFKSAEEEKQFTDDFKKAFGGAKRFNAMLLPHGIETGDPIAIENDKAQFIESRKLQRTVIAGALGVPPHLVGDLSSGTFRNVEEQNHDFVLNVVMPVAKSFESAMERDLLSDADRAGGIIVRFNLDSTLRADFKSRQEGLQIQRLGGVINPNEWREIEGKNPREGGDEYWEQGPSGQGIADEQI